MTERNTWEELTDDEKDGMVLIAKDIVFLTRNPPELLPYILESARDSCPIPEILAIDKDIFDAIMKMGFAAGQAFSANFVAAE